MIMWFGLYAASEIKSHSGPGMGHFPVFFLLGFGRIVFGLSQTAGSHGTDLSCLNITFSLPLCLSLSASILLQQYLFLSSRTNTYAKVQVLFSVFLPCSSCRQG